jgi:predicted RNA binding protein YcfA (HicA-like mRNA interferase family)
MKLPAVSAKETISALQRAGFEIHRVSGSHYLLKKGLLRVVVPLHRGDVKKGTLASIIKQAGLSVEDFIGFL